MNISVIGLGYVGLPLSLLAAGKEHQVVGLDFDKKKIDSLTHKRSYIDDIEDSELVATSASFTTNYDDIRHSDVIIICVPTPVDEDKNPDLSLVETAVTSVLHVIKPHALLIIESTVNPGVCDEVILPLIGRETKFEVGKDIFLAHCPERINPGDSKWNVSNINRVIGANDDLSLEKGIEFYSSILNAEIKPMSSLKEAEAVKIVENSFRDINIAFVNELAMSFHKLGINIENVIDGAATKPFAFMPHHPGCGVGGHCIPVDPYYLINYAKGYGFDHNLLSLARSVNESMPAFTVSLLDEAVSEINTTDKISMTLLGLSYKANIGDDRESPSKEIIKLLNEKNISFRTYDPYIKSELGVESLNESIKGSNAIILATAHDEFLSILHPSNINPEILIIIDGRNALKEHKEAYSKLGIIYKGIGV